MSWLTHIQLALHLTHSTRSSKGCSSSQIGYDIAAVVSAATGKQYTSSALKHLTSALVLHPVATGLTFIAFLIALFAHRIGFIFASLVAALAWLITLVVLVVDLVIFDSVRHHVNDSSNAIPASATFGVGIWLVVAAFLVLIFASFITCFGCFTDSRQRKARY